MPRDRLVAADHANDAAAPWWRCRVIARIKVASSTIEERSEEVPQQQQVPLDTIAAAYENENNEVINE
jgi:hypothetical protein